MSTHIDVLPGQAITARVRRQKRRQRPERQPPRRPGSGSADHRHPRFSATRNPVMARVVLLTPAAPVITAPRWATPQGAVS